MPDLKHYDLMAQLFEFPNKEFPGKVREVQIALQKRNPIAANEIEHFLSLLPEDDVDAMQELYTRSFDVQAITTLDVGYVLFGDDYKRGELLVNLNREHKNAEIDCGGELADHLPNVLRLLARLDDQELIQDIVSELLAPTLDIMIAEFDPQRLAKRNKVYKKHYKTIIDSPKVGATIYSNCLKALKEVIHKDFDVSREEMPAPSRDFLKSIDRELNIEI